MTIGIWQSIPQPMISRYLGQMVWDWIILDLQHGAMNWETAYECIHAIRATGARPLVRPGRGTNRWTPTAPRSADNYDPPREAPERNV